MPSFRLFSALSCLAVVLAGSSHAATILTFEQNVESNINLEPDYGSYATVTTNYQDRGRPGYTVDAFGGTPNIGLLFAPATTGGGSSQAPELWQTHRNGLWAGGVGQIEGRSIGGGQYQSTVNFIPNIDSVGVILESFNFIGDTVSSNKYQYQVRVLDITDGIVLYDQTTVEWNTVNDPAANNGAPTIDLDIRGKAGHELQLELTLLKGGRNDMAVDNIRFSQFFAIPEPSSAALLGGVMALGMLRRRRTV